MVGCQTLRCDAVSRLPAPLAAVEPHGVTLLVPAPGTSASAAQPKPGAPAAPPARPGGLKA